MTTVVDENLYRVVRPTVYIARIYALVPFTLETKKIKRIFLIISFLVSSYYFYGISTVYKSMYNNPILPKFEKLMLILQVSASSSVTISSWIANHFHFKKIICLFEKIKNVERLLVSLGMNIDNKKRKKIQYQMIGLIAFFTLNNCADNIILGENVISLFIIYTIAMLTLSHFLLLICLCQEYYTFINDKLKSVGGLTSDGLTDIGKLSEELLRKQWASRTVPFQERSIIVNIIKTAMESHSELYVICNEINSYFGLQILLNVTANILNVTSICYYVPSLVIDETDKPHHYLIISIKSVSFIALFAFVQLWVMAYVCSSASGEANCTAVLIHGIMNQPQFTCFLEQLDNFSTQLLHQKVKFTAHGFFSIDFSLINTVIGVVITYIVILIQFQMSNTE